MSGPDPITIDPIIVEPTLLTNPAKITNPTAVVTVAAAPRPDYMVPLELTGYGTKITRIGGDRDTTTPIGGLWTQQARHSTNQFWNDDMTMCGPIFQATSPPPYHEQPYAMILDGEFPYLPIIADNRSTNNNWLLGSATGYNRNQFRWRPGYPKQVVWYHHQQQMMRVSELVSKNMIWFAFWIAVDPSFGLLGDSVISADGRFVVLCTNFKNPQKTGKVDYFCVMDIEAGIAGDIFSGYGPFNAVPMMIPTSAAGTIESCSISPLGNYVVIKYAGVPAVARCFSVNQSTLVCTPRVFSAGDNPLRSVIMPVTDPTDPASAAARALKGWMMDHGRGDLALTEDAALTGSSVEVLVGGIRNAATSNHCSNAERDAQGKIVAQSLLTGKHMHVSMGSAQLAAALESADQHTSARCYRAEQILHTYAYHASNKFADEMVLWPVLSHGGVGGPVRCGTTRTGDAIGTAYMQAQAVPSPGCEKIVFSSDWQRNASPAGPIGDYKSYILEPISTAVVQESDYVIEVQSTPEHVGETSVGNIEPTESLRYYKR